MVNSLVTMVALWAWPFTSFLSNNQDDLYLYGWSVAFYGLIAVVLSLLCAASGLLLLGRSYCAHISNTIGVAGVLLFLYLPLSYLFSGFGISLGTVRIVIWLGVCIFTLFLVWRVSGIPIVNIALLTLAVVMLGIPAASLGQFALRNDVHVTENITKPPRKRTAEKQPNVYWFVFDGYAREDVLREYFGADNSEFIAGLRERNFQVSSQSYSNYVSTKLSISTTVNLDYYIPTGVHLHPSLWTARIQGFNPVVQRFKELGYKYIHAEPGGENLKTRCGGVEDACIKAKTTGSYGVNEAEVGLLRLTPLFPIISRLFPNLISFDFIKVEDIVAELEFSSPEPRFLFAHVLSPHPPRRFTDDCTHIKRVDLDLSGNDYSDVVPAYVNDLRCLNRDILNMVDLILAKDDTGPVVILQSDHGFRGPGVQPLVGSPAVLPEYVGFANFSAMLTPETCDVKVEKKFTPVNTFRVVFSCIDGTRLEMLPNRYFKGFSGKLEEVYLGESLRK